MSFYAGFETGDFPGLPMMNWLNQNTNLKWCGYYLEPAPNRSASGWTGQYADLATAWGLVPIYVGQQDPSTGNGHCTLTSAQGTTDAINAANLAAADGFPAQSYIYLDWEAGDLDAAGAIEYIQAWISGLITDARFMPGVYCSHVIADKLVTSVIDQLNPTPNVRIWCWKVPTNDTHAFTGDITNLPELDPGGCGFPGANIWQRENNAVVTMPTGAPLVQLKADFDTASMANPSAPSTSFSETS